MSGLQRILALTGLVLLVSILIVPSFIAEQSNNQQISVQKKLKQSFLSNSIAELQPFLSEGKRVFSNWEDVFGSTGYFGLSQFRLSFSDFYKKYRITSCFTPQTNLNEDGIDKILLEMNMKYQDRVTHRVQSRTIYILLLKQKDAEKPMNPRGWVIIEIKTIQ